MGKPPMSALGRYQVPITHALAVLAFASLAAYAGDDRADQSNCESLDTQAIKLARQNRLSEAAETLDTAIAQCSPDASRLTSRGVVAAALGDKPKAELFINRAIELAEKQGNTCRADMSRAELIVIRGGPQAKAVPESCKGK